MTMTDEPVVEPTGDDGADGTNDGVLIEDPKKLYDLYSKKKAENDSLRQRTKEAEAALETFRTESMSDIEKTVEKARKDAISETNVAHAAEIVGLRLKAAAGGVLTDPADAARHIDIAALDSTDDSDLEAALVALVKDKPYLAATGRVPSADQGPQGELTGADDGNDMNSWLRSAAGHGQ